jgi:predicted CopG family antitoxin
VMLKSRKNASSFSDLLIELIYQTRTKRQSSPSENKSASFLEAKFKTRSELLMVFEN